MPYKVVNTFRPMTPWGEGIQNVAQALFGGPTPADMEKAAAAADMQRSHADLYRTQAAAARAKLESEAAARADMASAPQRFAAAIFGDEPTANAYLAHRRGDQVDAPVGTGMTGGLDEQDIPQLKMRAPMPGGVDPSAVARYNRSIAGIEAAKALPGNDNVASLGKVIAALYDDEVRQRALGGNLTPGQAGDVGRASAAVAGKPIFNNLGNEGVFDQFGGGQTLNDVGTTHAGLNREKGKTEVAHQGAYRAQAGASAAHAKLYGAQTEDVNNSKKLVPALTPEGSPIIDQSTGQPVMVRQSDRGSIMMRGGEKRATDDNSAINKDAQPGKALKVRSVTKPDQIGISAQLESILQNEFQVDDLDPQAKQALLAQADSEWQNGAKDYGAAVREALRKVAPDGVESGGFFSKSKIKGGPRPQTQPVTTAPAAAPAAPPAARGGGIPAPKSQAEYDALPVGAQYLGTDGVPKIKRAKRNADGSVGS